MGRIIPQTISLSPSILLIMLVDIKEASLKLFISLCFCEEYKKDLGLWFCWAEIDACCYEAGSAEH